MAPPLLKLGDRVRRADGVVFAVRAMYLAQRARAASVALRSLDGAEDYIETRATAEAMERVA